MKCKIVEGHNADSIVTLCLSDKEFYLLRCTLLNAKTDDANESTIIRGLYTAIQSALEDDSPHKHKMSLHDFYRNAYFDYASNKGMTYCHYVFNYLTLINPELAEKIRETDMDPCNVLDQDMSHSKVWAKFIEFIERNW